MHRIVVFADDLTGANDAGIKFHQNGYNTVVSVKHDAISKLDMNRDVLVINTDTRKLVPAKAYQEVFCLAKEFKKAGIDRVYKKIDSTMRGNPGAEIEAVMDAWNAELALVVPAYPANRRVVQNGYVIIGNEQELYSVQDVVKPFCHVPTVLKEQTKRSVGQVDFKTVRQGEKALRDVLEKVKKEKQILVIDALTEEDLEIIAKSIERMHGNIIVSGSAGLAGYLTKAQNSESVFNSQVEKEGVVLLISGSFNSVTAKQVQKLSEYSGCKVNILNTESVLTGSLEEEIERILLSVKNNVHHDLIMVVVDSMFQQLEKNINFDVSSEIIASALGTISSKIVSNQKIKGLVLSGGDTAVHICDVLGVRQIDLAAELLPGIPYGYISSGKFKGLSFVTKAGGFGTQDAFIQVFQHFKKIDQKELGEKCEDH